MRHGKKLVSVPESEYQALLGLLTGNDPIKKEKFLTDKKIAETLNKSDLTQLEKGVKYQALSKKRKILNKKIQDKPFRVLIEHGKNTVMPTSGVAPAAKTEQQVQEIQQQRLQPKEEEVALAAAEQREEEREEVTKPKTADIIKKFHSVIDEKFSNKLYDYVDDNREELGISNSGEIYLNMKHRHMGAHEGSNFHNVLDYMLGRSDSVTDKKSIAVLGKRIMAKEEIKELVDQSKPAQKGQGRKRKKYVVDLKPAAIKTSKTRGLARGFKPVLWNKIPV